MPPSILFAEFHPWHADVKVGGHHYAGQFAGDGWRVLWLANFLNLNRLIRRDPYDTLFLNGWQKGVHRVDHSFYTYTPFPLLPYLDMPLLSSLAVARNSLRWCMPSLDGILSRHGFNPVDVLWISQPRMVSMIRTIRYKRLVYRMFDDVQHFEGEPDTLHLAEEWLCRQANVVFATSHYLVEKARKWSPNVVYLPNGADVDRLTTQAALPAEFAAIPAPRLLYVGAIAEWFDFDLLFATAASKPDWSFVLVGPWYPKVKHLEAEARSYKNIYYLGPKTPDQVPGYMQHADVGFIPFILSELTHSVSPIKLFEYSAAGLPIVSSRMRELEQYHVPIFFYETPAQFISALDAGTTSRAELGAELVEFGKNNSWKTRYDLIQSHLW